MGAATAMGAPRLGASPSQDPRASSPAPGFLLERGRFTTVAIPPRLAATAPQGIGPMGINDRGQIVGEYIDDRAVSRGFLLDRSGRFTRIDVPGAKGTNATKINNRGQIVGVYSDTSPDLGDRPDSDPTAPTFKLRGFLLDRHGRFTRLDFPGSRSSQARSINDRGQVVGEYQDTAGSYHGYVWERGGFRTIDAPGAAGTSLFDSNDRGQLLGIRLQLDGTIRGFLLDRGRFTTFDGPGGPVTYAVGINEAGQIVGFSFDPADLTTISGFLRDARGRLSAINRPGAISTAPFGINNRGQIVGLAQAPGAAPGRQPEGHPPMGRMA
jgi:probable HAF family extracellular repeat protein